MKNINDIMNNINNIISNINDIMNYKIGHNIMKDIEQLYTAHLFKQQWDSNLSNLCCASERRSIDWAIGAQRN